MSAYLIDGKSIAAAIREDVRRDVAALGFEPGLAVILVGDDPASHLYVRLKERACVEAGIRMEKFLFDADAPQETIIESVRGLNARGDIDALLVQLPLPAPLDAEAVIAAIDPDKDVDGFHPTTIARFLKGDPVVTPGLVAGIMALIASTDVPLAGAKAAIVANSDTFYRPLAKAMADAGVVPTAASADDDLAALLRGEDIVVVAVGRPGLITGAMLKPGCVVIDVGTTRVGDKVLGDADPSVRDVATHVTPVPGGVGPMTVAMLLKNTVALALRRRG